MSSIRIGLIGDHDPAVTANRAIPGALDIAAARTGNVVEPVWIETDAIDRRVRELPEFAGLWCVPGSPYASMDGALVAVRFAREAGLPFLGTCAGFQHALLEYARNALGLHGAGHAETDPGSALPLIAPLSCALVERTGILVFEEGSRLGAIYAATRAREEYHCSYGLNPRYEHLLDGHALRIAARDRSGEVRAIELPSHPFFIATLFQPERSALRGEPHPLVEAFVSAAAAERSHRHEGGH